MTEMENESFNRTEWLLGSAAMERFARSHVIVFGVGGVGSYVVEALARAGIGHLTLVDKDVVSVSNLNRQLIALHSTIGRSKVEVCKERILDINRNAEVFIHQCFYLPDTAHLFDFGKYDYVVDAVDTVTAKLLIVEQAASASKPIISCMGTGNKLDPSQFEVTDISKTTVCPLAKVMRKELRKRGINHLKVLYSKEEPIQRLSPVPGSVSFVPSIAGLMIAGEVIRFLSGK